MVLFAHRRMRWRKSGHSVQNDMPINNDVVFYEEDNHHPEMGELITNEMAELIALMWPENEFDYDSDTCSIAGTVRERDF